VTIKTYEFKDTTVSVRNIGTRFIVTFPLVWEDDEMARRLADPESFFSALLRLEEACEWRGDCGNSLLGSLCSGYEPAHILVGLLIEELLDYTRGGCLSYSPPMWRWLLFRAMETGYLVGRQAQQQGVAA
jgi:hypothetical protein